MKILKVLLLLLITASVSTLKADDESSNRYRDIQAERVKMRELYNQLDLTYEQKIQMSKHQKSVRKYREQRRKNRNKSENSYLMTLVEFISKDGFDKKGYVDKKMINIKARVENRADMMEQRMNILTPEQRVLLIKLLKEQIELKQ